MPDRDELAAWLGEAGHEQCGIDLRNARMVDAPGVAYAIAEHVEEMCGVGPTPETEALPAALRNWADTMDQLMEEFSTPVRRVTNITTEGNVL